MRTSLRLKLAVGLVALATAATVSVGVISYRSTEHELRQQVDRSLTDASRSRDVDGDGVGGWEPDGDEHEPPFAPGGGGYPRAFTQILVQELDATGAIRRPPASGELPVGDADVALATSGRIGLRSFSDVEIDGESFRMLTFAVPGGAIQLARSLAETDRVLDRIRDRTLLVVVGMAAAALLIGLLIAQQVTRRLVRLTEAATRVAASGDLDVAVPVDGTDETGRLGVAFNGMLASLARSKRAQHQLVQDAGHELRTPLTSLRTNVSVMRRFAELSPASQQRLLEDLDSETRELSDLVNELVQLATERRDEETPSEVRLADAARQVVDRAVRRSGRAITLDADDSVAVVRPAALDRAMSNVVANAVKFSDGPVDVLVRGGRFEVLDRGPGIAAHDAERVFDRFYRSLEARAKPGSGLGLAIVRDMAEAHGGSVFALPRDGGGSRIGFVLPVPPPPGPVPDARHAHGPHLHRPHRHGTDAPAHT